MRDFKFRVWSCSLERYLSDDEWCLSLNGELLFKSLWEGKSDLIVADPKTYIIEQYTGLNDKNGTAIYEGDLVNFEIEVYFNRKEKCVNQEVFFEEGVFLFGRLELFSYVDVNFKHETLEVIGNIHEK